MKAELYAEHSALTRRALRCSQESPCHQTSARSSLFIQLQHPSAELQRAEHAPLLFQSKVLADSVCIPYAQQELAFYCKRHQGKSPASQALCTAYSPH